ncbi:hypothetical protein TNCV_4210691 [Trichonephila clavipes]|nr:hypothetical protein TNCV_4210691 [Trichonephila clavipes]
MLDRRQIWGSGRPRKSGNSAETVLLQACCVKPSIVLLKNGSGEPLVRSRPTKFIVAWARGTPVVDLEHHTGDSTTLARRNSPKGR